MSEYRVYETKNGVKYWKDKRFVKATDIPENILGQLQPGVPYSDDPKPVPKVRGCLFCGEPPTKMRLVNLQTVDLCDKHYYGENVGRIVQQLREKEHEQSTGQGNTESAGGKEIDRQLQED